MMATMWLLGWFLVSIGTAALWVAWCAARAELQKDYEE